MDKRLKKAVETMLYENAVRSDTWIARSVNGASPEIVRGRRFLMERQGEIPCVKKFVDPDGKTWVRDVRAIRQTAIM